MSPLSTRRSGGSATGWRPRNGGPPNPTVRRPLPRALVRTLGRPLPGANLLIWVLPFSTALSVAVRIAVAVGAVLMLGQSVWSELRTSVEFRPRELVITNSLTRYTVRADEIREIGVSGISSGLPEFLRSGVRITRTDGRLIHLQGSLGLSEHRRTVLCDTLHDWARANGVDTAFRLLGPAKRWSD
ncbi:hypothetical protein ACFW1A_27945 [Kitasatospora sp. NPDC058965]|uniref:hypothetical protein n=1 Tax=Kitasatospora sp. NPDC058965 TaxID=3346682 RepID=UPI0036B02831